MSRRFAALNLGTSRSSTLVQWRELGFAIAQLTR